ncbi:MAG: PDZ domain-containing protein [Cytophagales bacterium]|nr:PDZ domain-containing protein [Armatimonadota bacterium]
MTSNEQQTQYARPDSEVQGRKGKNRLKLGYISGVVMATGAAMAFGVSVSHRGTTATDFPLVTSGRSGTGGGLTVAGGGKPSQVAQAPGDGKADRSVDAFARYSAQETPARENGTADLRTFESVYGLVDDHYVDTLPDATKMSRGAVRAMVSSLGDPNSFFVEPEQRALLDSEAKGRFAGIGAVIGIKGQKKEGYTDYKIVVVDPLPGSPAAKAGLKSGDIITHVDGKWVLGSDPILQISRLNEKYESRDPDDRSALIKELEAARKRTLGGVRFMLAQMQLRKGSGEKRTLTVERAGSAAPIKADLVTALTDVDPVTTKPVNGGKANLVRISLFTDKTAPEVKEALAGLPKGQGIVLDLRGNPGGSLAEAQKVGALFAPGKPFAVEIGQAGKRTRLTSSGAAGTGHPLVVLVDKGTARTAEALAASLQDASSATLIGGRTFGDGMSRMLYNLRDGSGFVLTTGKLISPKGYDWQLANGLAPKVPLTPGLTEDQVVAKAVAVLRNLPRTIAAAPVKKAQP